MRNMALVGLVALGGCGDDGALPRDAAVPTFVEVALIPPEQNQNVDVLFVIDDSPSMLDKQNNLKNSFPAFLSAFSPNLPNLHIGVITTDMGTLGADDVAPGPPIGSGPGSCSGSGKAGTLQTNGSPLVSGNFISDANGSGNYTGDLSAAFASIASPGASGCGFEQPLAAISRALVNNPSNVGFIRAAARLAIIVLSDEDDCSMAHSTILSSDTLTYGPLQSFRCTRYGIACDVGGTTTDEMNTIGAKSECHSNESGTYLADIARYKALLDGLKPDPRDVLFGAIVSTANSLDVELRTPPAGGSAINALKHSCSYTGANGEEVADPAVRLTEIATQAARGTVISVCNSDLQPAMLELGQQVNVLLGAPCIGQPIAQPAQCEVFDVLRGGEERQVPACSDTSGSPCYSIVPDATLCPAVPNLKVVITRTSSYTRVRCVL